MKAFFQNINLPRALILVSLVGIVAASVVVFRWRGEVEVMRRQLDVEVPKLAHDMLASGQRHSMLSGSLKGDQLSAQANVETYIRSTAQKDNVDIGEIGEIRLSEYVPIKGIVDKKYSFTPKDKQRAWERLRLINFFFSLEDDSPRIKLTRVKLENAEKRLKPHEIPDDRWIFEAEVSSRQRAEG